MKLFCLSLKVPHSNKVTLLYLYIYIVVESLGLPAAHSFRDSPAGAAADDSDSSSSDQASEKRAKLSADVPQKGLTTHSAFRCCRLTVIYYRKSSCL